MAVALDQIRALAERVAASHHLEVVDVEFGGGGKSRALRIFIEKDAAERAKLKERAEAARAAGAAVEDVPSGVPVEVLSGVTLEDCSVFAQDFGPLLDVEDVVPGAAYTLEVSSPGLERKLSRAEEYARFAGSVVRMKLFAPVNGSKVVMGRLMGIDGGVVKVDVSAAKSGKKPAAKAKKGIRGQESGTGKDEAIVAVPLRDVEKANLVAEMEWTD